MINQSIGKAPFEVVYTWLPKYTLDLVLLPKLLGLSNAIENMVKRIKQVHSDVRLNLEKANSKYMQAANKHMCAKIFQEGDLVMVHLRKQCFLAGTYNNKLQLRKFGPCHIIKKINDNAYEVDLPDKMLISFTFQRDRHFLISSPK